MTSLLPAPLERDVQRAVVQLFEACGGIVYSTSQGYRHEPGGTRCTPGLPDLVVFIPRRKVCVFWETKRGKWAPRSKRTNEQIAFGNYCAACNQAYGFGGVEEAKTLLRGMGMVA